MESKCFDSLAGEEYECTEKEMVKKRKKKKSKYDLNYNAHLATFDLRYINPVLFEQKENRIWELQTSNAKDWENGVCWANPTVTSGKRQEVSSMEGPTPNCLPLDFNYIGIALANSQTSFSWASQCRHYWYVYSS